MDYISKIKTPERVSPSPKRKGKRSRTPPARRAQINEVPEIQPFRPPTPLTPIGWDVDAAKAAGTVHPASTKPAAQKEWTADDPNNPNAVLKRALKRAKAEQGRRKGQGKGKPKAKAKAKATGQGQQDAPAATGGKGGKNTRIIRFNNPRKGKGRGKGKKR